MTAVTTRLIVAQDGSLSTADPLPAGEYLVSPGPVATGVGPHGPIDWSTFPTIDLGPWPTDFKFDRSDIYGDDRS